MRCDGALSSAIMRFLFLSIDVPTLKSRAGCRDPPNRVRAHSIWGMLWSAAVRPEPRHGKLARKPVVPLPLAPVAPNRPRGRLGQRGPGPGLLS